MINESAVAENKKQRRQSHVGSSITCLKDRSGKEFKTLLFGSTKAAFFLSLSYTHSLSHSYSPANYIRINGLLLCVFKVNLSLFLPLQWISHQDPFSDSDFRWAKDVGFPLGPYSVALELSCLFDKSKLMIRNPGVWKRNIFYRFSWFKN